MESTKKKRNSILRKPKETEEELKSTLVRSTRKISFNRRASVREFIASEETKAWDNSYDVSDPKNNSENTAGERTISKNATKCNIDNEMENKENVGNVINEKPKEIVPKVFDFTVIGNEVDHFQTSRSLSVESTTFFCRDLEKDIETSTTSPKTAKNMQSDTCDMEISQPMCDQKAAVIFTASHVEMNLQQETLYINENVDESDDAVQQKTRHFNEDLEPTIFKVNSKTIHFKTDDANAMDISLNQHKIEENADISMGEASFAINCQEEPMEITSLNTPKGAKGKIVVKHTNLQTKFANNPVTTPDEMKNLEEKTKYFDESLCNFNVEDSKKDSTTLLANASLDSDPTLHEFITHNGGAKLNFLELNEKFEKGHVKAFSHTPPIKKFNTPKNKLLTRLPLFDDNSLDISDAQKKRNENALMMALTPCSKKQTSKGTPESSNDEFERMEDFCNYDQQQTLLEQESMLLDNKPSVTKTQPVSYNRRHTIRATQDMEEDGKMPATKNRRGTMLAETDMVIDGEMKNSVQQQSKNKRYTVLAPSEMVLDEKQQIDEKMVKTNRRQTVLAPHEMTMDESLCKPTVNLAKRAQENVSSYEPADLSLDNMETEEEVKHAAEHFSQLQLKNESSKNTTNAFIQDMQSRFNFTLNEEKAEIKFTKRSTINYQEHMELEDAALENDVDDNGCNLKNHLTITETDQMEITVPNSEKINIKTKYDREICKSTTFMGNEEIELNNEDDFRGTTNKEYHRKRLTFTSNEPIELDMEEEQFEDQRGRRLTCINNESIELENKIESVQQIRSKRLTVHDLEEIELESEQIEDEPDKKTEAYRKHHEEEEEKRYTFNRNKSMEIEKEATENARGKRLTVLAQEQMELEEERDKKTESYRNHYLKEEEKEETQNIKGKRLTVLAQEQMELEEERDKKTEVYKKLNTEEEEEKRYTLNRKKSMEIEKESTQNLKGKRLTVLVQEQMELENENIKEEFYQKKEYPQEEENRHSTMENEKEYFESIARNKRLTITANEDMELVEVKQNMAISLDIINKLEKEMNCAFEALADAKTTERNEKINRILQKRRMTVTAPQDIEIVAEKSANEQAAHKEKRTTAVHDIQMNVEIENKQKSRLFSNVLACEANQGEIRAPKHKRDQLDKSIESASPAGKKCNQMETPKSHRKSLIPKLVNAKKLNDSNSQIINIDQSLDTIPIPRRHIVPMDKSIIEPLCAKNNLNETKNAVEVFEDNPITLSDTTVYMPVYEQPVQAEVEPSFVHLEQPRFSINTTVGNMMNCMNLSSAASSLLENESALKLVSQEEDGKVINLTDSISQVEHSEIEDSVVSLVAESFAVKEPNKLPEIGLKELQRLRQKTTLFDDLARPRRISLDLPWNFSDVTLSSANNTYVEDKADEWLTNYKKRAEERLEEFAKQKTATKSDCRIPGIDRLCKLLEEQCENWTLNKLMINRQMLQLKHKCLPKACFVLVYEEKEDIWQDVELQEFYKLNEVFKVNWLPIHHLMDFQLKLELPRHLKEFYKYDDYASFTQCLNDVGQICKDIFYLSTCMCRILFNNDTNLIRVGLDTYAQKIVRRLVWKEDDEIPEVQRVEFRVVLRHMRQTNFKNIEMPGLHLFHENVQLLPIGLDFLKEFFEDPVKYMK